MASTDSPKAIPEPNPNPNPNPAAMAATDSPKAIPEPNPNPNPNPAAMAATDSPKAIPEPAEPLLVGYRVDDSPVAMINLLNAKKSGVLLLKDPTIEKRVYSMAPWKLIGEDEVPALPDSNEHLFYSSRSLQVGSDRNYQRQLDGVGVDDVLHFKRNHERVTVYDFESFTVVGYVNHFTLKFSQYNQRAKDVSTNWHMVEFESVEGSQFQTLCKLRLEDGDVKKGRARFPRLQTRVKAAEGRAASERSRLNLAELPEENEVAIALGHAQDDLLAAEVSVFAALEYLKVVNDKHYLGIVEPRRAAAAAAAAHPAPAQNPAAEVADWAVDLGQRFGVVNNAAEVGRRHSF